MAAWATAAVVLFVALMLPFPDAAAARQHGPTCTAFVSSSPWPLLREALPSSFCSRRLHLLQPNAGSHSLQCQQVRRSLPLQQQRLQQDRTTATSTRTNSNYERSSRRSTRGQSTLLLSSASSSSSAIRSAPLPTGGGNSSSSTLADNTQDEATVGNTTISPMGTARQQEQQQQQQRSSSPSFARSTNDDATYTSNSTPLEHALALAWQADNSFHDSASSLVVSRSSSSSSADNVTRNNGNNVHLHSFNALLQAWVNVAAQLGMATQTQQRWSTADSSASNTICTSNNGDDYGYDHDYGSSSSVSTARQAAERATHLLLDMEARAHTTHYQEHKNEDATTTAVSTATTTAAAATTNVNVSSSSNSVVVVVPNIESYNCVLRAWQQSKVHDAPQMCERLLQRIMHDSLSSSNNSSSSTTTTATTLDVPPDTKSFQIVLRAWADAISNDNNHGNDDANAQEVALERMIKIQRHMQHEYERQLQEQCVRQEQQQPASDTRSTLSSSDNIATIDTIDTVRVKPTIETTNCIIKAHVKCIRSSSVYGDAAMEYATRAHTFLTQAKKRYNATHDFDDQPNAMTYTRCMEAYAHVGSLDATLKAEQLLHELKQEGRREQDAATTAQRESLSLQPTTRAYNALITAWSKTKSYKAPHNAEALLKEMRDGTIQIQPNAQTYTKVIQAWARSRDATKPQRALSLLKDMKQYAAAHDLSTNSTSAAAPPRPTLATYNAAIDACAQCQGTSKQQVEALKIAFCILKAIEKEEHNNNNNNMVPNPTTYTHLLRATALLLPIASTERNKVATAVFRKAQSAGMVTTDVVKSLRKAVDTQVMLDVCGELRHDNVDGRSSSSSSSSRTIMSSSRSSSSSRSRSGLGRGRGAEHLDYSNIPPKWSRNVQR